VEEQAKEWRSGQAGREEPRWLRVIKAKTDKENCMRGQ
jgi:hypothetical protein